MHTEVEALIVSPVKQTDRRLQELLADEVDWLGNEHAQKFFDEVENIYVLCVSRESIQPVGELLYYADKKLKCNDEYGDAIKADEISGYFNLDVTDYEALLKLIQNGADIPRLLSDWFRAGRTEKRIVIPFCSFVTSCGLEYRCPDKLEDLFKNELENLTTSGSDVVMGISIYGTSTGVQIKNCKIHDIHCKYNGTTERDAHGIGVYGTNSSTSLDGLLLDGNEVYNCTLGMSESVAVNGNVTNFRVIGNRVHDNDNIGIDFIGFEGTTGSGDTDRARNGVCSGNQVWNITSRNNATYAGDTCADGLYVDGGQNIILECNLVYNSDIGIEAASEHKNKATDSITIRNNIVYGCKGAAGISFGGSESTNGVATNIRIFNNTLYNNEPNINIQQANSPTNIVENNICYEGTYVNGTIGKNAVKNNLTADPKFVDAANGNFHLQSGSPAIDAGVTSTYYGSTDFDGNTRVVGSVVDDGAFEHRPIRDHFFGRDDHLDDRSGGGQRGHVRNQHIIRLHGFQHELCEEP